MSYLTTLLLEYMQMTQKLLPGTQWHRQGDGSFPRSYFCWLTRSAPFSSGNAMPSPNQMTQPPNATDVLYCQLFSVYLCMFRHIYSLYW